MASVSTTTRIPSIPALLAERAAATPHHEALHHRTGDTEGWTTLTWAAVAEQARAVALGLRALGVTDAMRVAIQSGTRVEWLLADLGVLAAGGATTTIYPSATPEECRFILQDSSSVVVVAEDGDQVDKLLRIRDELPDVAHVVVIDGASSTDGWVLSWSHLLARGRDHERSAPTAYEEAVAQLTPERLATLIYTSGTTGRPKGVELTHGSWLYAAGAVARLDVLRSDDLQLLWLPLSHSFGKLLSVAMIDIGVPTAIDGRVDRIAGNLAELRPTMMAAAPRIFEKVHDAVVLRAEAAGGLSAAVFHWARDVAVRTSRLRQDGRRPSLRLRTEQVVADRLVFARLRDRLGGRIRCLVSGSAPLDSDIAAFFDGAGLTILEGYGLTESSAASFVNRPDGYRIGTVGHPLPGTDVRIAGDGEILIASPGVMRGYHGLEQETRATLVDGWLHTGDIGELDAEGRLRITDRKKELIKTSGGKYVAPQHVEGRIKAASPYIANALVHGDRRSYCTALVTLDAEAIGTWAAERALPDDPAVLAGEVEVTALVQQAIERVNASLARHETVKRFAILPADFSVEGGELTPSLKLRRRAVEARYAAILDGLYA